MGLDCCRPLQLRFVGLKYLFSFIPKVTLLTQLHLGLLHFRPALRGLKFRSQTILQLPFYRIQMTYQKFPYATRGGLTLGTRIRDTL